MKEAPVSLTEIAMFRAAAMTDSQHADERVRVAAVGMLRFLDSHEYHRRRSERLEAGLVKIREQGGNHCSCLDVARKTLEETRG